MTSSVPFKEPEFEADAFNCPHCGAYARMLWGDLYHHHYRGSSFELDYFDSSICSNCQEPALWHEEQLFYPNAMSVEVPNSDMPDNAKRDYIEAAKVVGVSPRSASALLRQAIQKICDDLIEGGGDLNSKIGKLVEEGLSIKIQKSLDIVRVVGNESVHPGQIDISDTPEIARNLFRLVNLIATQMYTDPREINELYDSLPDEKKEGIEKRDKKETT